MELITRADVEKRGIRDASRLSTQHRKELRALLGNPPDPRRVPDEFWERVEREERAMLLLLLLMVAGKNSQQHGGDDAMVRGRVNNWAFQRAADTARAYTKTSRATVDKFARDYQPRSGLSAQGGTSGVILPRADMDGYLNKVFGPKRDSGLITTELTAASVYGGEVGVASRGLVSAMDQWVTHPEDSASGVCATCEPLHGTTRGYWARLFPLGPPAHPNCKCEIAYAGI